MSGINKYKTMVKYRSLICPHISPAQQPLSVRNTFGARARVSTLSSPYVGVGSLQNDSLQTSHRTAIAHRCDSVLAEGRGGDGVGASDPAPSPGPSVTPGDMSSPRPIEPPRVPPGRQRVGRRSSGQSAGEAEIQSGGGRRARRPV